jgi:hypothetical protein
VFGANEGFLATVPRTLITGRDGVQQTAADLMQLVRVIEVGMDVHGGGSRDLDPSRVYYFGWSQGANVGTPFLAVEPDVQAGDLTNPGYSYINEAGWLSNRGNIGTQLAGRMPSLLNSPGITTIDGRTISQPWFDENMPLRNGIPLLVGLEDGTTRTIQSPVINNVDGAMAIQEVFDNGEWAAQAGNPVAYAPHLRKDPLAGVPVKPVIVQFAKGDQTATNPSVTALIRAGDLADRATFYRHDLAFAENPALPTNPHGFLVSTNPTVITPAFRAIALAAQAQIATFFASDGTMIIQPPGVPDEFFEVPIQGPLPEDLNYVSASAPGGGQGQGSGSQPSAAILPAPAGGSSAIAELFAAAQLGGTAVGPGAMLLPSQLLLENSLDPDPRLDSESSRTDQASLRSSAATTTSKVLNRVFADVDGRLLPDPFADYPPVAL